MSCSVFLSTNGLVFGADLDPGADAGLGLQDCSALAEGFILQLLCSFATFVQNIRGPKTFSFAFLVYLYSPHLPFSCYLKQHGSESTKSCSKKHNQNVRLQCKFCFAYQCTPSLHLKQRFQCNMTLIFQYIGYFGKCETNSIYHIA